MSPVESRGRPHLPAEGHRWRTTTRGRDPDTVRIYEIELYGKKTTVTPPAPGGLHTIDPTEMTVNSNPGQKGQFTATVTGSDDNTVTWIHYWQHQ